jgi:ribose-phosphate pyrophosphokinase
VNDRSYSDTHERVDRFVGDSAHAHQASMIVFAGSANPALAKELVGHLHMPLGKALVDRFSDGEVMVELIDSVRGKNAFVVQPTCASFDGNQRRSVDENLLELLILTDAIKRASANRVTAVMPYFGYARQDRRPRSARVSVSAKVVADMISAGADRVLTMDLHADQIQGFFSVPVDNIYASPVLLGDIWKHKYPDLVVVSPDVGGVVRARAIAKRLDDADLAIIDKRRPQANLAEVMNIIGDVRDRTCVIVDDMADTAGTLCSAATALKDHGASRVVAYCTHAVLSGAAVDNVENSKLDELVVTNSIPLDHRAVASGRIRQLSVAELLAESMRRINEEESIGSLFMD